MPFSSTKCIARSKPPGLYGCDVATLLLAALLDRPPRAWQAPVRRRRDGASQAQRGADQLRTSLIVRCAKSRLPFAERGRSRAHVEPSRTVALFALSRSRRVHCLPDFDSSIAHEPSAAFRHDMDAGKRVGLSVGGHCPARPRRCIV